jgi:methyl-accepting chemotaxis protein
LLSVFKPITKITELSTSLANEEYDAVVPFLERNDEIGKLSNALETLRIKAKSAFSLKRMVDDMPINIMTCETNGLFKINYLNNHTINTLKSLERNLSVKPDMMIGSSIDVFHKEPSRIKSIISNPKNLPYREQMMIGDEILDLRISAIYDKKGNYVSPMISWNIVTQNVNLANSFENSIGLVSGEIAASSGALHNSAITLQSAIEELSATALDISKRTQDSLNVVHLASAKGDDARNFMANLAKSSEKVSNVVVLIRLIAEKTNLLALNASIESARAGDAGKGFAVVANEVKALANQTANAITEINVQVCEMQNFANNTSGAIKDMCDIMSSIGEITSTIAASVEEQQASTAEIARSVGDIHKINNKSTTENASVLAMANQLQAVSDHLKDECSAFINKIRSL